MRLKNSVIFVAIILFLSSFSAFAQESELNVVDEVIAQVNDGVITLSKIKREMKTAEESFRQAGKTEAEAKAEVEKNKGQLIANIINEELLIQKASEIGLEKQVEARTNRQLLQLAQQYNLKSLDQLYQAMQQQNIDPQEYRALIKKQVTRDLVWESEVDAVLYYGFKPKDIKAYYQQHIDKFKKPATITISEIFLSFAGANKADVIAKAKTLVERARKGEDFKKLAVENSDRPNVADTKGKAGTFKVGELDPLFAKPLKGVKVGEITDPIEMEIGMEILRVDERTKGSDESFFDEDAVRRAMLIEKLPNARKKYMKKLREDAYIKIKSDYRALVTPALDADATAKNESGK